MSRIVGLALIVLFMALARFAFGDAVVFADARPTMSFGFLLLVAYLAGDVLSRFRVPKITGYILAGILFGPHALEEILLEKAGEIGLGEVLCCVGIEAASLDEGVDRIPVGLAKLGESFTCLGRRRVPRLEHDVPLGGGKSGDHVHLAGGRTTRCLSLTIANISEGAERSGLGPCLMERSGGTKTAGKDGLGFASPQRPASQRCPNQLRW